MKSKRLLAGILAMAMIFTTACGSTEDDSSKADTSSKESSVTDGADTSSEAESEAEEDTTESTADESVEPEPIPHSSEKEVVLDVAIAAVDALQSYDADKLLEFTDLDMFYRMQFGDTYSDEELADMIKEDFDGESGSITIWDGTITVKDVTKDDEAIDSFNRVLEFLNESLEQQEIPFEHTYVVTGAYRCEFEYEGEDTDMITDDPVYILNINGEWKLDVSLSAMLIFMDMFDDVEMSDAPAGEVTESLEVTADVACDNNG